MSSSRPIGYYVHHHGAGHRARAIAIADAADGRVTLIGTGLSGAVDGRAHLDLPDDRLAGAALDGCDGAVNRPDALHYAPLDHPGIRARTAAVANWIAAEAPALMVVDVSVEMAMLARLASVPTVVVRLSGLRADTAHREAFRGAIAILCPYARALDDARISTDVVTRTAYFPGIVRRPSSAVADARRVTVVLGAGSGVSTPVSVWADAARAVPDMDWHVLGPCASGTALPPNLTIHGWVDDVAEHVARSAVVVGAAGDGIVGTVLAAGRPFVCAPEDRPFDEQRSKGRALEEAGAAILCHDLRTADWAGLIAAARGLDPARAAALDDADGAERAADWLLALAEGGPSR